ncbi:MAG: hypothetical protein COB85_07815 [Bacteroidetes bacterium]|nr:MAG: hypothetical protein COB85_07815 [Bacteroidota bacterium]
MEVNSPDSLTKNRVYFFHYRVQTVMNTSKISAPTTEVKLYTSEKKTCMLNKEMEVYQDSLDAFTVLSSKKLIYRQDPQLFSGKDNQQKLFVAFQDSLLELTTVRECREFEKLVSGADILISLELNNKSKAAYKLERLDFYLDRSKRRIKKVITWNLPSDAVNHTIITWLELDYNHKMPDQLKGPVAAIFLDAEGRLQKPYGDFTLIDTMKRNQ